MIALQGEKTIERGARPDHKCVVDKEGVFCEDRVWVEIPRQMKKKNDHMPDEEDLEHLSL